MGLNQTKGLHCTYVHTTHGVAAKDPHSKQRKETPLPPPISILNPPFPFSSHRVYTFVSKLPSQYPQFDVYTTGWSSGWRADTDPAHAEHPSPTRACPKCGCCCEFSYLHTYSTGRSPLTKRGG